MDFLAWTPASVGPARGDPISKPTSELLELFEMSACALLRR